MNGKRTTFWGLTLFILLLAGLGARASLISAELCPVQIKGRIRFDNANPELLAFFASHPITGSRVGRQRRPGEADIP